MKFRFRGAHLKKTTNNLAIAQCKMKVYASSSSSDSVHLLCMAPAGQTFFWWGRTKEILAVDLLRHHGDPSLLVSAPRPEDPPPDFLAKEFRQDTSSQIVRIQIPEMPPAPGSRYRRKLENRFPGLQIGSNSVVHFEVPTL